MEHAIIDFGSNTIRLSIYEVEEENPYCFVQLLNKKTMAGLVGYIDRDGIMSKRGIEKSVRIMREYKKRIDNFNQIKSVDVFGTAVLRNAKNADEICQAVFEATGYAIDKLDGMQEAHYGFIGAMAATSLQGGALIDVGGSSSEIVIFNERHEMGTTSLPVGSLSMFMDCVNDVIPTPREMDDIRARVRRELVQAPQVTASESPIIVGVGGSVRSAEKIRNEWLLEGFGPTYSNVKLSDIKKILSLTAYDPKAALHKLLLVVPERVHTALPGIIISETIATELGAQSIKISRYGIREGYLLSHVLGLAVAPGE